MMSTQYRHAQRTHTHRKRSGRVAGLLSAAALATATLALATPVSVDAAGWSGFTVTDAPSVVGNGLSPSWGVGVTTDLGGPGIDIWNNNHGNVSEAIIDIAGAAGSQTSIEAGDPTTIGPDTHGVAFSDIDGDGDEDLFEVMGRNNANRVFRNDSGRLTFIGAGGLEDPFGRGRQPIFVDFDNDGDMDVVVTNLDLRSDPVPQNERQLKPSEIYLNNGNGTAWTKVPDPAEVLSDGHIRIASLTSTGPATAPILATHDVFTIAKDSVTVGTGTMAEPPNPATRRTDTSKPIREVLVGDFDNDLYPEFIAVIGSEAVSGGTWPLAAYEVSDAGAARTVVLPTSPLIDNCRSAAAADFDNDGDLDILAGCAQRQEGQNLNVVLRNDGTGRFLIAGTDILAATIPETPGAIVVADMNADGWMDAFVANGYDFDRAIDHVYTNRGGTSAHWLTIDLVGSNPDAMGAQVFVGTDRWQIRESGHRYHRSQDQRALHVGLGSATTIAPLEIRWPDGTYETCRVTGIDRSVTVRQGGAGCTPQTRAGLLAAVAVAPVVDQGPPPKFCEIYEVTVDLSAGERPTAGDDVILGTSAVDVIDGLDGDDIICGLGGADTIRGGAGSDRIYGGAGHDVINGGPDRDFIFAGKGNDLVDGGDGGDRIRGGFGRDRLFGSDGNDRLWGKQDDDNLFGGPGADRLWGNRGVDRLDGGLNTDQCQGGARFNCEG